MSFAIIKNQVLESISELDIGDLLMTVLLFYSAVCFVKSIQNFRKEYEYFKHE